jgi:hypothetical protein
MQPLAAEERFISGMEISALLLPSFQPSLRLSVHHLRCARFSSFFTLPIQLGPGEVSISLIVKTKFFV